MKALAAWRARATETSRSELEWCTLRVIVGGLVLFYLWSFIRHDPSWTETDTTYLSYFTAWLVIAVGFLVATWVWPAPNVSRRALAIILDMGAITAVVYLLDARGSLVVFAYLFVIFGNGFRYGRGCLFLSQSVSLVGLLLVATNAPWWKSNPAVSFGWFLGLIVIPLYVSLMVERVNAARLRAEQALKECIERQSSRPLAAG